MNKLLGKALAVLLEKYCHTQRLMPFCTVWIGGLAKWPRRGRLTPGRLWSLPVELCLLKGDRRTWVGSRVETGDRQQWPQPCLQTAQACRVGRSRH